MSVYEGINHIHHPETLQNPLWNYIVLGVSVLFEGISFVISVKKFVENKGSAHFWHKLRLSKDPSLFVVIFEDGAALIGLFLAFCGVFSSHYFQMPLLDGAASVLIGIVLAIVAVILIIESRNLLIGESADKKKVDSIYQIVSSDPDIRALRKPLTMQMAPEEVMLALDVEFADNLSSHELTRVVRRLEQRIRNQFPDVKQIFIEANNLTKKATS